MTQIAAPAASLVPKVGTHFSAAPIDVTPERVEHYLKAVPTEHPMFNDEDWVRAHTPYAARIVPAPLVLGLTLSALAAPTRIYDWALGLLALDHAEHPAPVLVGARLWARCEFVSYREASQGRAVIEASDEAYIEGEKLVYRGVRRILVRAI